MLYKDNKCDDYHFMLLNAFARNNIDMWNEFIMEFTDEVTPLLPVVNSTSIRCVRAFLHEFFDKPHGDFPKVKYELLEKIGDTMGIWIRKYHLDNAVRYPRLDLKS